MDGRPRPLRRASSTNRSGVSYSKQEEGDNVDDSGKETYEVEFKNEKLPKLKKASPRFPTQVRLLLSRSWKQYIRDSGTKAPLANSAVLAVDLWTRCQFLLTIVHSLHVAGTTTQRLIINLVIALITGLLFLRMGHSQSGTRPQHHLPRSSQKNLPSIL